MAFAYARTCEHLFDDGDDLDDYLAADYAGQSSFIESSIRIRDNDRQYLLLFARLIHSLVRVNPEERDPEEAMRIIKQLESLKTS
ncbi:hypothetical protein FQN54_003969 [Arachnomyces sp. PD_36]|nr:hypothetical protein FQN54_003969 [Arachnomyces sp. PD_36]